jgi:DNA-binding SARP family transcriptional activator
MYGSTMHIEFLSGAIAVGERRVTLTRRQAEVLSVLALRRRRLIPSDEIVSAVWPDKECGSGAVVLKVVVHRLRRAVGDYTLIDSNSSGYALGATVTTDLDELESLGSRLRGALALTAPQVTELRAAFSRLTAGGLGYGRLPQAVEDRTRALIAVVGERLGAHALRRGDFVEALALSTHLLGLDACDESAWEITIRAHTAMDDRASAIRAYRRYANTLATELGIAPSAHILSILSDPHARTAAIA